MELLAVQLLVVLPLLEAVQRERRQELLLVL